MAALDLDLVVSRFIGDFKYEYEISDTPDGYSDAMVLLNPQDGIFFSKRYPVSNLSCERFFGGRESYIVPDT